ncbi:hypothetical protein Y032_0094g2707 [Ancylostoma ceylanicum]|uniref:EB domain-containing protein n=1 Tax=Ancylostoma ceylanicum TaxID=53326 RepID=A0A016TK19_9BILA|nr:hypothetical protein Y032_0094g2707 [Ancylostoma ceylanicum]
MFEVVLPSSSLGISFDCSKMPCPTGYSCVSDVFTPRRKVCCGTPNTGRVTLSWEGLDAPLRLPRVNVLTPMLTMDVCPNGLQPVNDPRTLLPISCRGGQFDVCPPNYHCLLHPTKKRHFCCGSTVRTETCPSGSRLIRLETGQPLGCNSQAVCPGGTTCQRPNPVGSGVCCKTLLHACPSGFVLDQTALEECSPLHRSHCSSTSSDSLCLFAETLQKFVCCKRENQLLPPLDCCPVTSTPKPRYFSNEQQCSVSKRCKGQTVCLDGKCVCRPGQVQLRMMCYWKCPANRKNVDGICV